MKCDSVVPWGGSFESAEIRSVVSLSVEGMWEEPDMRGLLTRWCQNGTHLFKLKIRDICGSKMDFLLLYVFPLFLFLCRKSI